MATTTCVLKERNRVAWAGPCAPAAIRPSGEEEADQLLQGGDPKQHIRQVREARRHCKIYVTILRLQQMLLRATSSLHGRRV